MIKLFLTCFCLCSFLFATHSISAATSQGEVKREIKKLSSSLEGEKDKSNKAHSEIRSLEKKLGIISNKKYQTRKGIKKATVKLQEAIEKKKVLKVELDTQREALAQQLQALYSAGEQSHLRLLLRQDDPSEISRTMKYFEYLNDSRVLKIKKAQATFNKFKKIEIEINNENLQLQNLTKELGQQEKDIKGLLAQRSRNLKKLETMISTKELRLDRLLEQEGKLQAVVEKVAEKLPENKQEKELVVEVAVVKVVNGKSVKTHDVPNKQLTQLKGKLSWPVAGKIIHSYGSKRNGHQKWKGVVLAAPAGKEVKAIAKGEVVFSDWMEGYGHLIIIQHNKNYLSLYGYNRSVYKKEGTRVQANEVIAAVGSSGGQSQSALYFEIRKGRTPQNPSRWCK